MLAFKKLNPKNQASCIKVIFIYESTLKFGMKPCNTNSPSIDTYPHDSIIFFIYNHINIICNHVNAQATLKSVYGYRYASQKVLKLTMSYICFLL